MMAAIKWQDWPVLLPDLAQQQGPVSQPITNNMLVLRRMLQELLSEQLLPFQVLAKQDDRICLEIKACDKEGQAIHYRCHGRLSASFFQVRLDDECIMRHSSSGSRPLASVQELIRELGPEMGICELMLARYAREVEAQLQTELHGCNIAHNKRRRALHEVLLLEGETALPFAELRSLDSDGEPIIADWIASHGTAKWINTLLEVSLQPMIHLLYGHGIGIEADCANMVLLHRNGLPCRVALKELPAGLHLASQFSASAGATPVLMQADVLAEARGDASLNQVLTQFYSATMLRNFGQLSIFLREHFAWPELKFWQQVANCIYRYQDARPHMALRFASFDLFAELMPVERSVRGKLLGSNHQLQMVRNPLHRFARPAM